MYRHISTDALGKFLYAADLAENTDTEKSARGFGLCFKSMQQLRPHNQHKNTEVVYQPAP